MKFLVIGCGSIGRRHIKNLIDINAGEVIAADINQEYSKWVNENLKVKTYNDAKKALTSENPDAVLICTHPSSHIKLAMLAAENNAHVFIEKPISNSLDGIGDLLKEIKRGNLKSMVGYNLRFNKGLQKIKKIIENETLGKTLYSRIIFGQYLPEWRPWQDYRESYTARKEMGGGIILDGSHEVDYALWLFGKVKSLVAISDKVSNLEVNVEDTSEIILQFENGVIANIHADFVRRDKRRVCEIAFEKGTVILDFISGEFRTYDAETKEWKSETINEDSNEMYVSEMRQFIEEIKNNAKSVSTIEEAMETLRICLEIKKMVGL